MMRKECVVKMWKSVRTNLAFAVLCVSGLAVAMPTKDELKSAEPIVQELMAPELKLLKSGGKKQADVAASALELAKQAEGEAAKLLLYRGSLDLFVRAGEGERAVETLRAIRAEIADVPLEDLASYAEYARRTFRKANPKAPEGVLGRACAEIQARARAEADLKATRRALKKKPADATLQRRLAELQAAQGDWSGALALFAKLGAKEAKAVENETERADLPAAADFWYDYAPSASFTAAAFRGHAAELYRRCLDENLLKGLLRTRAERRAEETEKIAGSSFFESPKDLGGVQLWENGPYWAECDVGATKPEERGSYFWWGDTVGYKFVDKQWIAADGSRNGFSFTKENCPTYGKSLAELKATGYVDATGNLVAAHDAATVHLGAPWRMPTDAEIAALTKNCASTWTTRNGVVGRLVTGKGAYASKSIFLPTTGYGKDSGISNVDSYGDRWSSTPNSNDPRYASDLSFDLNHFCRITYFHRRSGFPVRPVRGSAK